MAASRLSNQEPPGVHDRNAVVSGFSSRCLDMLEALRQTSKTSTNLSHVMKQSLQSSHAMLLLWKDAITTDAQLLLAIEQSQDIRQNVFLLLIDLGQALLHCEYFSRLQRRGDDVTSCSVVQDYCHNVFTRCVLNATLSHPSHKSDKQNHRRYPNHNTAGVECCAN